MKQLIISMFIFLFFHDGFSQSYHRLIRDNTFWDVLHRDGSEICMYSGGNSYFFQGDTMIQSMKYEKVLSYKITNLIPGPFCPPFAIDPSVITTNAFLREDTISKKVYIFYQDSDMLLYDFSLSAGDTLTSFFAGQGLDLVVDSIQNLILLDGSVRQVFYLNNGEYYIESIGGSQGLFFPLTTAIGFAEDPICTTDNGVQLWGNSCLNYLDMDEISGPPKNVSVIPDPSQYLITIYSILPLQAVKIFDVPGELVYEKNNLQTNNLNVDVSQFTNGIYFLEARGKNWSVIKKVMKN
jgi:hypothetical protein